MRSCCFRRPLRKSRLLKPLRRGLPSRTGARLLVSPFAVLAGAPKPQRESARGRNAPNRHSSAAPAANPCVSGLVAGLPLQLCALAGRRPEVAMGEPERGPRAPNQRFTVAPVANPCFGPRSGPPVAVLRAHAASPGVARPRLEPQTFAQQSLARTTVPRAPFALRRWPASLPLCCLGRGRPKPQRESTNEECGLAHQRGLKCSVCELCKRRLCIR